MTISNSPSPDISKIYPMEDYRNGNTVFIVAHTTITSE